MTSKVHVNRHNRKVNLPPMLDPARLNEVSAGNMMEWKPDKKSDSPLGSSMLAEIMDLQSLLAREPKTRQNKRVLNALSSLIYYYEGKGKWQGDVEEYNHIQKALTESKNVQKVS